MKQGQVRRRLCPGGEMMPVVWTREEHPEINPGEVHHKCPVCQRTWARNTMQDWSELPIPRHFVLMYDPPAVRQGFVPRRYRNAKIQFWNDERAAGNDVVVTLHYGFTFDEGSHSMVKGFKTITAAVEAVRAAVGCTCDDCKAFVAKQAQRGEGGGS